MHGPLRITLSDQERSTRAVCAAKYASGWMRCKNLHAYQAIQQMHRPNLGLTRCHDPEIEPQVEF